MVSIHASVKDATGKKTYNRWITSVSIHASVKDATEIAVAGIIRHISFNPRICKRCDVIDFCVFFGTSGFNPRICKRCDSMFVKSFIDDTFKL